MAIFRRGDQEIERRIKSLVRWNALAMVVRANRVDHSIGGHISTITPRLPHFFEVGFNHFFRGRTEAFEGNAVYLQGHASPGVAARAAFMEGRLSAKSSKTSAANFVKAAACPPILIRG